MASQVDTLKQVLLGKNPWVLFENGTVVILANEAGKNRDENTLSELAIELLKEWGPVHAGSSAGDFMTIVLDDEMGWVVNSHHNAILTYVSPNEGGDDASDLSVGLLGRSKRGKDAEMLNVVHIEKTE